MATAMMRALAAHDERPELLGAVTLAELPLSEDRLAPLKDPGVRAWVMKNKIAPGAYEFMIARTRFFDELAKHGLDERLPQLVVLGAGYDSRAYRFRNLAGATHIFELDALPTQQRKREVLQRAGVPFPPHLQFVPIDFEADDIEQVLMGAGFDREARALFLWEGVSYYLSLEAVNRMLAAVCSAAAPGTSIAFDYASVSAEALDEEGIQKLCGIMKSDHAAEPTKFGIPAGKLEPFLAKRGYEVVEKLGQREMETRYLTLADGTIAGKVPALFSLVHARTVA
jgi:methyltransferase (TIGR00027 family)